MDFPSFVRIFLEELKGDIVHQVICKGWLDPLSQGSQMRKPQERYRFHPCMIHTRYNDQLTAYSTSFTFLTTYLFLTRVFQWHILVLFPITQKKMSHWFKYKILSFLLELYPLPQRKWSMHREVRFFYSIVLTNFKFEVG